MRAILDATEELLETTPLHDLSVGQILERANVARGSFYFYFDSKFAVVARLLADFLADLQRIAASFFVGTEQNRRDATRAQLREIVSIYRRHSPAIRAAAEHWQASPEIHAIYRDASATIADVLATAIEAEQRTGAALPATNVRGLAAALMWMNERCLYVSAIGEEPAFSTDDKLVEALTDVWLRTVFGPVDTKNSV